MLMEIKALILLPVLLSLVNSCSNQRAVFVDQSSVVSFDEIHLTESGQQAYKNLLEENVFAIGRTGEGGTISAGENNVDVVLQETENEPALYKLATRNSGAGGLYGLYGLKLLKSDKYSDAYKKYLELPDQEKRNYVLGTVNPGMVERLEGCEASVQKRTEAAKEINDGKFDLWVNEKTERAKRKSDEDKKVAEKLSNTKENR